ncbi:MAG: AAA family ATPase, partial [Planctomycetota bacterium]
SDAAIDAQLNNDLFTKLTFNFRARATEGNFGLVSINTKSKKNKGYSTDILIAESENKSPGTRMLGIPLPELLFTRHYPADYPTISDLAKKHVIGEHLVVHKRQGNKLAGSPQEIIPNLLSPAFEYITKTFQTAFLVSPYRHATEKMAALLCGQLDQNGSNLVNYIHNLNLNNYAIFKGIADFVKRIVPEVGRLHPRFVGESGAVLELAYEWPDGTTVNLANMGGGVEQVLILACLLIHQRTSCILWEEPESHLHPAAQEVLLTELEGRVGDSVIFLTTQSPVFVSPNEKVAVHAIVNKDGKSARGRTLSKKELQVAVDLIGSRPGHLAMADIVIYVEGKHGVAVIEEWLKKWPERTKVLQDLQLVVQSFNADEVGTKDFSIAPLKKVSPNMIMFADKDNEPGSNKPKKERKVLSQKCKRLLIPCFITHEHRQIEDYFSYEAVKKGLPANLRRDFEKNYDCNKTIGEQLKCKRYNRGIAAAMDWGEIEGHKDILKIFAEIKKYAEELKP